MKLAIMQPYFLPYIGYFQLMKAVDTFVCYDDVNYINKGWINRNNIHGQNGAFMFTLPLKEASQNKLINEIELGNDPKWDSKFFKTIEMTYKKAPLFEPTMEVLYQILHNGERNLAVFIYESLCILRNYLQLDVKIEASSTIYNNRDLKAQERILDICLKEKALQYINPIGGQEIYSKSYFTDNHVQLNFIKSNLSTYRQFGDSFIPWLSILDVMMFNDVSTISSFLTNYELV